MKVCYNTKNSNKNNNSFFNLKMKHFFGHTMRHSSDCCKCTRVNGLDAKFKSSY